MRHREAHFRSVCDVAPARSARGRPHPHGQVLLDDGDPRRLLRADGRDPAVRLVHVAVRDRRGPAAVLRRGGGRVGVPVNRSRVRICRKNLLIDL